MQKTRLRLDFSLNTNIERKDFLDNYLKDPMFEKKPPTADELEMMANYLLWGKDPTSGKNAEQDGLVAIDSNKKTWQKKDVASLDELLEQPTFCESALSTMDSTQYRIPKETFSREETLRQCPESMRPTFLALFAQIDKIDMSICQWELMHGKREKPPREQLAAKFSEEELREICEKVVSWTQHYYLKQRHLLVELRQEQYTLRDSYHSTMHVPPTPETYSPSPEIDFGVGIPILPMGLAQGGIKGLIFRPWRELIPSNFSQKGLQEISDYYWKMKGVEQTVIQSQKDASSLSSPYIDLRDLEHVYQLLSQLEELDDIAAEHSFGSNLEALLSTLRFYIEQAELSELQREILEMKLKKVKNQDIAIEINKKYDKSYTVNYISTIFRQRIIPKINAAAAYHENVLGKIYFEEEFKQCPDCGITYLIDADNFVRRGRSKDGFATRCKRCDKLRRELKKI